VNFERALAALEATLAEDTGDRRSRDTRASKF
jgi:hypothetical protein